MYFVGSRAIEIRFESDVSIVGSYKRCSRYRSGPHRHRTPLACEQRDPSSYPSARWGLSQGSSHVRYPKCTIITDIISGVETEAAFPSDKAHPLGGLSNFFPRTCITGHDQDERSLCSFGSK